ncbi:hypothetical protein FJZ17_04655 [Candidatus Pacearchaeota archaeon]|nr:hypothetical protein [Candidatus Pacearchaeota archaeon]
MGVKQEKKKSPLEGFFEGSSEMFVALHDKDVSTGALKYAVEEVHQGEFNANNGVLAFIDREGRYHVGKNTPTRQEILRLQGFKPETSMHVPLSAGPSAMGAVFPRVDESYESALLKKLTKEQGYVGGRVVATTSIIGLASGIFFLGSNITGNVIADLTTKTTSFLGAGLLVVGLVAGFFWMKDNKR